MDQVNAQLRTACAPSGIRLTESALLPSEVPLDMPVQPAPAGKARPRGPHDVLAGCAPHTRGLDDRSLRVPALRRFIDHAAFTILQGVFLALCTMCFAWVALGSSSAVLGFVAALLSRRGAGLVGALRATRHRTALLFPVYQEDTARIAATIEAIADELKALGAEQQFDVFVLSDSRVAEIRARELRAIRFLRRRLRAVNIYYRVRKENTAKKAGNIADWVTRFGGAYEKLRHSRRRQHHVREFAGRAANSDGERSRRGLDPDRAATCRRTDALCTPAAIRGRILWTGRFGWLCQLVSGKWQLLGTQCHPQDARVRGSGGPTTSVRSSPLWWTHPKP